MPEILPPFTAESARAKVKQMEALWNTCNPDRVAAEFTEDTRWRNRVDAMEGHEQVLVFLRRKWIREQEYRLRMELWCWGSDRIAVSFRYEWHDREGQWFRSYGTELWEFAADGLIKRRVASINDLGIDIGDRQII